MAKITHIAESQLVRENTALRDLEKAAGIIENLRLSHTLEALPVSCVPRLRQLLSRIETGAVILRKTTIG